MHGQTEYDDEGRQEIIDLWNDIMNRSRKPAKDERDDSLSGFWSNDLTDDEKARRYEIYIGYLYESRGWRVIYAGILNGLDDSGIDLICSRGERIILIQCKNWAKDMLIREKHVHQFFGSVSDFKLEAPEGARIGAVFFTSAMFSDKAKDSADKFNIVLREGFKLEKFPCIKCKVQDDGEQVYFTPYDSEYFTTRIIPDNGDFFAGTIDEAESSGFEHRV